MKNFSILKIPPSETIAINTMASEKIRAGEKVFNLSAGEPMLAVSPLITQAVMRALKRGETHYPPVAGIPDLRRAGAKWMNEWYGANYEVGNTLAVPGGKFGLFILFQALLKPKDEVLIPAPYWVSYPHMVQLFGAVPKFIKSTAKSGWKISPNDIARVATSRTKMLILNNGGNPTGTLYTKKELQALMAAAARKNLFIISDEVYSTLVYDKQRYISCASFIEYRDRLAVIQSCSKSLAMTGLRVGFVFAEKEIISALSGLVSQSTSGVATLSQWAALAGLTNVKKLSQNINTAMEHRRNVFMRELNRLFKQKLASPASGLYAFVPLSALGVKDDSKTFCLKAMEHAGVALVPGSAFGQEGYVRFSFGENEKILVGGLRALAKWLKQ